MKCSLILITHKCTAWVSFHGQHAMILIFDLICSPAWFVLLIWMVCFEQEKREIKNRIVVVLKRLFFFFFRLFSRNSDSSWPCFKCAPIQKSLKTKMCCDVPSSWYTITVFALETTAQLSAHPVALYQTRN